MKTIVNFKKVRKNKLMFFSTFFVVLFSLFFTFLGNTYAESIIASNNSWVAPLGVSFSVEVSNTTAGNNPFHDLTYKWNFGDEQGSNWAISWKSKNTAQWPITGHVFENPGNYNVTLTVLEDNIFFLVAH